MRKQDDDKTKRKRYSGAFKAKVGLEALMGMKTVGQIARDYQVHPVQVTQWGVRMRDHLPELFESPRRPAGTATGAVDRPTPREDWSIERGGGLA